MSNRNTVHLPVLGFGQTLRKDAWWVGPALTVAVLSAFIVYATFRAFENDFYTWEGYLSPFYSPFFDTRHIHLGIPFTPAMLILPFPASFRLTCYYYRKAYYRSFAMDPPACAVGERNAHSYNGETKLLLFQNLHRYALYASIVVLAILWKDAVEGLIHWSDGHVHVGVGVLVMFTNCILLSGYTFGCHSFRHLIGGNVDSYSTAPLGGLRYSLWKLCTKLNQRHQIFAWTSLISVAMTDVYIRAVAKHAIVDMRLF